MDNDFFHGPFLRWLVAISEFENGDLFYRKAGEEDA